MESRNMATRVSQKLFGMVESVSDGMAKMGNDEPFDAEKVPLEKQLESYQSMTPEMMFQMIGKHGRPAVEKYVAHFEGILEKRKNA